MTSSVMTTVTSSGLSQGYLSFGLVMLHFCRKLALQTGGVEHEMNVHLPGEVKV